MKRTVQINLFGTVYTIDEDAHQLLEQYLKNMKSYFGRQAGGEEIADDIEHRVAELFWDIREKDNGWSSISIEQVKDIIQTVGNPEQMTDANDGALPDVASPNKPADNVTADGPKADNHKTEDRREDAPHNHTYGPDNYTEGETWAQWLKRRRFYRDPEDKRIGGVISGLCHYFGQKDPTMWRLGYAVLCFLAMTWDWPFFLEAVAYILRCSMFVYLLLWMIAPEADTAEDRLRMKGKPVNPDSINDELLHAHGVYGNNANNQTSTARATAQRNGCLTTFTDVIALCVKALLIIIGIGMAIAFIFPIVALIALLCNAPTLGHIFGFAPDMIQQVNDDKGMLTLLIVALITVVALPIYAICRWLMKTDRPLSAGVSALLVVLWIIALGYTLFSGINLTGKAVNNMGNWNWNWTYTNHGQTTMINRYDNVDPFSDILVEGVGSVTYRQVDSDEFFVSCNGPESMVNATQIYVENGVLKIIYDETSGNNHEGGFDITITSPTLTSAKMQGVGSLTLADTVRVSNPVELRLEGVGSLKTDYLEASKITASNEGVGSSQINVKCDSLIVSCQGVGSMKISGETRFYQRNQRDLLGTIKDSGLNVTE